MKFKNPLNDYTVSVEYPWLWCLLFGFLYFAKHGAWAHALISFVLACLTMGGSWLLYPFFAAGIVRDAYLRRGWKEIAEYSESRGTDSVVKRWHISNWCLALILAFCFLISLGMVGQLFNLTEPQRMIAFWPLLIGAIMTYFALTRT